MESKGNETFQPHRENGMINKDWNPSCSPNSQFIDKNDTELKSPLSFFSSEPL